VPQNSCGEKIATSCALASPSGNANSWCVLSLSAFHAYVPYSSCCVQLWCTSIGRMLRHPRRRVRRDRLHARWAIRLLRYSCMANRRRAQ
jgi:hypothetical protein